MIYFTFVCLALLAHSSLAAPRASGCSVTPVKDSALVVTNGGLEIVYPKPGEDTLELAVGEVVDLVCPGSKLENVEGTPEVAEATCVSDQKFEVLGESLQYSKLTCSGSGSATSRRTNASCANGDGVEAEIGFSLDDGRFLRTILLCFDSVSQSPIWSTHNITASIGASITGTARPSFTQDDGFYDIGSKKVNSLYTRTNQRKTINSLLGLSSTSTKYIQAGAQYYLARGHLAPNADFYYPVQRVSTFRYINAAPQFQTFNAGNWAKIESAGRSYAEDNEVDIQVWTGIYSATTLPHETTGEDVSLAIYEDSNGNTALPVPELYWKVLYNGETKKGIAVLGINNPYQDDLDKSIVCTDVSENVSWLPSTMKNQTKGYSYVCSVPDLKKVIDTVPDLDVTGLLE